jgi:hypothetical protein
MAETLNVGGVYISSIQYFSRKPRDNTQVKPVILVLFSSEAKHKIR